MTNNSGNSVTYPTKTEILAAKSLSKRIAMCIRVYRAIEQSALQSSILEQFAWDTEEMWFNQERRDPQEELPAFSEILSRIKKSTLEESDAENQIDIAPDEVINYYFFKYKDLTKGAISFFSKDGYSNNDYYSGIWEAISSFLADKNDLEKGICLYIFLLDKRTPYYAVKPGLRMSNKQYQIITENIMPQINKLRFILDLPNGQKTETASQILDLLDEIKDKDHKVVFLSQVMSVYSSKKAKIQESEIS